MTFIALVVLAALLFTAFSRISRLEARIAALEAGHPIAPQTTAVVAEALPSKAALDPQTWVAPVYEHTESAQAAAPDNIPAVEIEHSPTWVPPVGAAPTRVAAVAEHSGGAAHTTAVSIDEPVVKNRTSESSLGGTWFTAIGALALIIAGAFFFRYAVDNGWISETLRVVMALMAGALILAVGVRLRGAYEVYAGIVAGLGLSLMMLGVFAAGAFYGLWSPTLALTLTAALSISGAFLAAHIRSQLLLVVAFVGAYIAPFLFERSSLGDLSIPLYALVVAIGIAFVSYRVAWKIAAIVALMGSYAVSAIWILDGTFSGMQNDSSLALTLMSLAGLFIAFSIVALMHYARHGSEFDDQDATLVVVNAFGFLGAFMLAAGDTSYAGAVTFVLGGLHAIAWWAVKGSEERASRYRYALGGIALTMLALFVPIQFDSYVVSLSWSALALVAAVVAARNDSPVARWFSGAIFTLAFVRLITWESSLAIGDGYGAPMFNERVFVFAANAAAMLTAAYMVRIARIPTRTLPNLLSTYGFFALFVLLHIEFMRLEDSFAWFAASASLLASIVVVWGARYNLGTVRMLGYLAFVVYAFTYLFGLGETKETFFAINLRTVAALTIILAGMYAALTVRFLNHLSEVERAIAPKLLATGTNIILLAALTKDVIDIVEDPQTRALTVSLLWLGYAVCAMVVGITYRWFSVRRVAIFLLGAVVFKVFLVDAASFDDFYRFLSYGILGVILLGVGYAYNRYRSNIDTFIGGAKE
jgi:uncharacterized membrane protein